MDTIRDPDPGDGTGVAPSPAVPEALLQPLRSLLPDASLAVRELPQCPEIRLMLLEDAAGLRKIDDATALRIMNNPLYWLFCWASGQVLARLILDQPQRVAGRRVLDFGCGSGVVAIAAALAGAEAVIACDCDPLALEAARYNARVNGVSVEFADDLAEVSGPLDLILVADVLYDRSNLPLLPQLSSRAPSLLLADSRVRNFAAPGFTTLGVRESCTIPDLDESREFNRVTVYQASDVSGFGAQDRFNG